MRVIDSATTDGLGAHWGTRFGRECVEALGNDVELVTEQAAVDIQSHRGGGVSEHPLHRLDVRPGAHGQACRRVTQFVAA